jgi:hypothetical protein
MCFVVFLYEDFVVLLLLTPWFSTSFQGHSMAPKLTCQQLSEFDKIWVAKFKKIDATLFNSAVRLFGKRLSVTQANEDEADFCAVFLSQNELKTCKSDAADA